MHIGAWLGKTKAERPVHFLANRIFDVDIFIMRWKTEIL